MPDKRMTEDDVVAELRDGMTIGIGGWGSRRKPMSLVRAILRSTLQGPHHRHLRRPRRRAAVRGRQGAQGRLRLRVARLDPARAALPGRPPDRRHRDASSSTRACSCSGLQAAAWRVPFLPTRAGLGSDVRRPPARAPRRSRSPYADGEELVAVPALDARRRARPHEPGRRSAATPSSSARPLLRRPVLHGRRPKRVHAVERSSPPSDLADERPGPDAAHQPAAWSTAWSRRPTAPTSPSASPTTGATRRSRRSTPRRAKTPEAWAAFRRRSTSTAATRPSTGKVVGAVSARATSDLIDPRRDLRRSRWPSASAATARSSPTRSAPSR